MPTTALVLPATPVVDPANVIKDSALFYTRDVYLWNTQVPSSFDARGYADPSAMMTAIHPYSTEPGFSSPVDRWSFAMKKTEWDQLSSGLNVVAGTTSAAGDLGLSVFFRIEGDLRVSLVEPNSPAGLAGIHRGWRIIEINNSTNITTANASFIIDNIYNATSSSITFQKPDGSTQTIPLQAAHYQGKPVYLDTVYNINNKKTGYLVFNSFLGDENKIYSEFQRVFSRFAAENISNLVVDLRYNGGGYVSVQKKLADYIAATSADGGIMMKQIYNSGNSANNETTLFHKTGGLNLSSVYFIVSKSTASASELLINNLKPYMDVKLVGAGTNATHGKPVGFFPIPVGEWYIFPVSFRTINKNGEGNYFNGLPVNASVADGLDKDWGDRTEASLASTLNHIVSGNFRVNNLPAFKEEIPITKGNAWLGNHQLKSMIGTYKKLK